MRMDFGITLKSDMDVFREVKIAKQAEAAGFNYLWSFDSHVLWQECFPRFALWAWETKKMRIGTLVTNPVVRDVTVCASLFATLQNISKGRMDMGIGRGDSSRRRLRRRASLRPRSNASIRGIAGKRSRPRSLVMPHSIYCAATIFPWSRSKCRIRSATARQ